MSFTGATEDGEAHRLTVGELAQLPQTRVVADLHCASKWSVVDNVWDGVRAQDVVKRFPPAGGDRRPRLNGEPLTPEHGLPIRLIVPHLYSYKGPKWFRGWEYLPAVRRGFWEERGYHLLFDPWAEERYSYQERYRQR